MPKLFLPDDSWYPRIPDLCYCRKCNEVVWGKGFWINGHHNKGKKRPKQSEFMEFNNPMKNSETSAKFLGILNPMKRKENREKFLGDLNPAKRPEVKKKLIEMWKDPNIREKACKANSDSWTEEKRVKYAKSHSQRAFPHYTEIQGYILMHRWDRKYAQYLDSKNIPYEYENHTFPLILNDKETSYTPDFYLPETNEYIEVKGYWRDDAELKYKTFQQQYPNMKITLFMEKNLKSLGINLNWIEEEKEILKNYKNGMVIKRLFKLLS